MLHLWISGLWGAGGEGRRIAVAARYWLGGRWLGAVGVVVTLVGASVDVYRLFMGVWFAGGRILFAIW